MRTSTKRSACCMRALQNDILTKSEINKTYTDNIDNSERTEKGENNHEKV